MKSETPPIPYYQDPRQRLLPTLLFGSPVEALPTVLQENWRPGGFTLVEAGVFCGVALYRILTAPFDANEKLALMRQLRGASPTVFKVPHINGFTFTPIFRRCSERSFVAWETEDHILIHVRESQFLRLRDLARYNVTGDLEVLLGDLNLAKFGIRWLDQVYLPSGG